MNDITYQWKTDKAKKFGGVGVSEELSSLRFNVAALNTRQEAVPSETLPGTPFHIIYNYLQEISLST